MARKTIDITVGEPGRDQGKTFRLREMDAMAAEKWALRALLAIARSGVPVPDGLLEMGFAGLLMIGVKSLAGVDFRDLEPLLDETTACIRIVRDPGRAAVESRLMEGDVEEVKTLLLLRRDLFTLHTGFMLPAARSGSAAPAAGASA